MAFDFNQISEEFDRQFKSSDLAQAEFESIFKHAEDDSHKRAERKHQAQLKAEAEARAAKERERELERQRLEQERIERERRRLEEERIAQRQRIAEEKAKRKEAAKKEIFNIDTHLKK